MHMFSSNNIINKEDYTILIVDDEQVVIEQNVLLLELEGYKIISTNDGKEAIEMVKKGGIDIILLDFFMPGITGEQVVEEIRKFNDEVVIILQTGYAGEKPPLEMLEKLNIQGYHDKTEGTDKLLLWVAAGTRACAQMRDLKRAFEEVALAHETIKSIRENQARLIEQERLASLGQLIGGISHNLKTPIMSISGGLEAIKDLAKEYDESIDDTSVTKEDHHEISKEIDNWADKLKPYCAYMTDIITAVKDQAVNLGTYSDSTFDIDEMIKKIEILMKHELKYGYCKLNMDIQVDTSLRIKGAINNLIQVFNNLISNAIQAYEGKGGDIDFKILKDDDNVEFIVKDYAKGMPEEVKTKLFKEMITTKGSKGTGLGVYTSYSSIKGNFSGDMWFESEEGRGTEFHIVVPFIM